MGGREGAALLVAGHGASHVGSFESSAVHVLGQIGEALLATGAQWHIRRLTANTGDRYAADRATIKRSLNELVNDEVRVAVVVLVGSIIDVGGELALVTGSEARDYPEDATLPLAWIHDRLAAAKAEQLVVAISGVGESGAERWMRELATERPNHLIAIAATTDGNPLIDALLGGLCGDAVDRRTGTVTMASLSEHLAQQSAVLQRVTEPETIAQPPPLAGLWDVRRSQLGNQPRRSLAGQREDLTGIVLPGRFRIDELVARGTFGTVYRARQLAVERDVAVKVLHADIDPSSEDGRLFVHEIRSVGRIDHANVVRIYQADITYDGRLFFAMELLGGVDLQQLGAAAPLPQARAIELVRQLLAGLGAAHDAGLVHADIKPANAIVVPRDGGERLVLVDFGLARLRAPNQSAESAGGTPAYMAPEQLSEGRVDARSDLFSAALVLVYLLTGWRRPNSASLVPPLDGIADEHVREVLARALSLDPARRYPTARELAAALTGSAPAIESEPKASLPFHQLAPLTESDHNHLHGRADDLALLTEHVLYRRAVIYTGPSGTGKTSLLRAGLLPRLEALGICAIYVRCRADCAATIAGAIAPGSSTIAEAVTTFHRYRGGKLVLVADQVEAALGDPGFVAELLGFERWPRDADVSVVVAIREDTLARLVARTQDLEHNLPIVRLPPLAPDGARAAIALPLAEARLSIEPELLEVLLADLQRAAAAIGPEMGWGQTDAVFPPHLQLVCSVLYEALAPGEATITLAHYRRLGGFETIVGEHLDRVIETELADGRDLIARDLFVALVTASNERAVRAESELLDIVGAQHGVAGVTAVLETLRSRGLLLRVRGETEPSWELVHDSLVPRVLAWIDRKDLARRRAIELVRYHLRRSTGESPSLLGRRELREIAAHAGAVDELEHEWSERQLAETWTPKRLVTHSRRVLRRRAALLTLLVGSALAIGSFGIYRSRIEQAKARHEEDLRDRDLGRFVLALEPFEWGPDGAPRPAPPGAMHMTWRLHSPSEDDLSELGEPFEDRWLVRGMPTWVGNALVEHVEAHGGAAFLVIDREGCTSTQVPLRQLPGYTRRAQRLELHVAVPTCAATRAGMVEIPAGPFWYGGLGTPVPSEEFREMLAHEPEGRAERVDLAGFAIDRTEVPNRTFRVLWNMSRLTGIEPPAIVKGINLPNDLARDNAPAIGITWREARALCRFLGKELPTSQQWQKALRGGEHLGDALNRMPDRNFPWGTTDPSPAGVPATSASDVGANRGDISPYGVLDLAGNVSEWTSSRTHDHDPGIHVIRGGNWADSNSETLVDYLVSPNIRPDDTRNINLGVRCALSDRMRIGSGGERLARDHDALPRSSGPR
ncbi:MAG TPA: SUMF1/EgtB/PvdO family nonheme iron enzyme [Kofleriaceae bacterium]|nr:SUMF1/EgtB/PvdO family nonheme iron enzyme [Kofleriaceae bacterium]